MGEIVAIILAAGESKRMNSPKMLLPFRGKTIIETLIDNVTASIVNRTIVVVGANKDNLIEVVKNYPVSYCSNDNYRKGMLSSVQCGFSNLPGNCEAALVFPGDQPMIPARIIDAVIAGYHSSKKGLVMPVYKGKRGHPLLISTRYRAVVENMEEVQTIPNNKASKGLRMLLKKYPGDVLEVESDTDEILRDIDTQKDYQREIIQNH